MGKSVSRLKIDLHRWRSDNGSMPILLLILLLSGIASAKVEVRWMSCGSILLKDESSSILFDAYWTRPEALHFLNLKKLKSDETIVKDILKKNDITKLDAVFVAHTHLDHVLDAPLVASLTGATYYGDEGASIIARAYEYKQKEISVLKDHQVVTIGKFVITVMERHHSPALNLIQLLPGKVEKDFNFGFYEYKAGTDWFFLVQHPEGTILMDNSQEAALDRLPEIQKKVSSVDLLVQGVNHSGNEIVRDGYVKALKPKIFMPTHYDRFLSTLNWEEGPKVLFADIDGLRKMLSPVTKFVTPTYGGSVFLPLP